MPTDIKIALIGMASGLLTLLIGEVFRRWRSVADRRRDAAENQNLEADSDHKTMDALTKAFEAISQRQAEDINDLRERLRRVEDALLISQQRNDQLAEENVRLHTDCSRLRNERDRAQGRVEQLEGELRLCKQVAESATRVYGQDENPDEDTEPTP